MLNNLLLKNEIKLIPLSKMLPSLPLFWSLQMCPPKKEKKNKQTKMYPPYKSSAKFSLFFCLYYSFFFLRMPIVFCYLGGNYLNQV